MDRHQLVTAAQHNEEFNPFIVIVIVGVVVGVVTNDPNFVVGHVC